ncbi:MAG TPA: FkbM family methyltransferase, partial [Verrucomicrobiae bacterium]|nr:FkbM family methyltransferase [Verrucomicrobiae bacterium]
NIDRLYPDLKKRVKLHNVAVSREPGVATFYFDKSATGLSSLAKREWSNGHEVEEMTVKVTTLDKLVKDRPDFVKIDIEGAEYDALCGAKKILKARPLIAFEFDPTSPTYFKYTPEDFAGLFHAHDYLITDLFGHAHDSGAELMAAPLWNFLAIPRGMDVQALVAPARKAV